MYDDTSGLFKASNLEQIFMLNLFRAFPGPFIADPNQMYVQANKRGGLINQYTWDVRTLAERFSSVSKDGYKLIPKNSSFWYPLIIESFNQDQGTNYIQPIETFNPVTAFANVQGNNLKTTTQINFSPYTRDFLTDADYNDNFMFFNNTIHDAFILPGLPLIFTGTFKNGPLLGPQFVKQIEISIDGRSPLSLNLTTTGARSIRGENKAAISLNESKVYRLIKNFDCAVDFVAHESAESFFKVIKSKSSDKLIKISKMSITVNNDYSIKFTGKSGLGYDKLGPRFFTLSKRSVEGTLVFIAASSEYPYNLNNPLGYYGLTMYFGNNLLFILPNILWQKPKVTLTSQNLYLHEYKFIAFACDYAKGNAYKSLFDGELDISEFRLPSDVKNMNLKSIIDKSQSNG